MVKKFLNSWPYNHLEICLRLQPAGIVLSNAGVFSLILPLKLESCQGSSRFIQFPTFKMWRLLQCAGNKVFQNLEKFKLKKSDLGEAIISHTNAHSH